MFSYIKIFWNHDNDYDPTFFWYEVDEAKNNTRIIIEYPDGTFGFASRNREVGDASLSPGDISIEDFSDDLDGELSISSIDKDEFENRWDFVSSLAPTD